MYMLEFLRTARGGCEAVSAGNVGVEYRLACSGELYNRNVQTLDWRRTDISRVLLKEPFELFVASQPFATYPQELCLRMTLRRVEEKDGNSTVIFIPDEDVAEDLCSILSVLSRPDFASCEDQRAPRL